MSSRRGVLLASAGMLFVMACGGGSAPVSTAPGGAGAAVSIKLYSPVGGSLTLYTNGTALMTAPDNTSASGTYTKDSTGKYILHLNGTLPQFADATGTIDSRGCLEVSSAGTTVPWCPAGVTAP